MERLAGAARLDTGIGCWFQNLSTNQGMRQKDELAGKQNGGVVQPRETGDGLGLRLMFIMFIE
jgi:hypothetical protein